jgi:hypothetical protein
VGRTHEQRAERRVLAGTCRYGPDHYVSVLSCVGAGGTLAYDRRVLAPVDRVEITIVIDNFLDVLMASEEGVARYQARDFGASEQLVAEHGFSALVAVERPRRRTSPSRPP